MMISVGSPDPQKSAMPKAHCEHLHTQWTVLEVTELVELQILL